MVNLEKGGKILLEKENNSGTALSKIKIGLGWDEKPGASSGHDFDLDASAVCIGADGKCVPGGFLYYGSSKNAQGMLAILNDALVHTGDNLTGEGEGDDEAIIMDLGKMPENVDKVLIVVNIYQAGSRNQNFGMAENSFCRLVNEANQEELVHFDLNFDASTATGVKFATIFKRNGEWAFSADQVEFEGGLESITQEYAIS